MYLNDHTCDYMLEYVTYCLICMNTSVAYLIFEIIYIYTHHTPYHNKIMLDDYT